MKKRTIWFWISPVIFGALVLIGIRLVSDVPTGAKFWQRPLPLNLIEILFAVVFSYIFQAITYLFLRINAQRIGKLTLKKLLFEYLSILVLGLVVINPLLALIHFFTKDPPGIEDFVIASIVFSLLLIIAYSILRGNQILNAYVDQKLKTQEAINTQMETELKYLKAQFHPHFLFNALNTIYFQIDEANETPRKTIEQLSELLRYQLYDVNQTVRVEQELNFILTYVELQKVRTKETLRLDIAFDPLLKDQKIHSLLLFPLVENAFKYVGGEYWIKLEAKLMRNSLCFNVKNAVPEKPASASKAGGIGLENLRRRLDLLYEGKYELKVSLSSNFYAANLKIEW